MLVIFLFQTGDVLVVHCTDVGWSPYFSLIAGLITEIGGLISHGAVVAREYGIPCIVNLPDATLKIPDGTFLCVCVCTELTWRKLRESLQLPCAVVLDGLPCAVALDSLLCAV